MRARRRPSPARLEARQATLRRRSRSTGPREDLNMPRSAATGALLHGAMACAGDASGGSMRKCPAPLSACMLYPSLSLMCVRMRALACSCTLVERWWCRLVPCARVALTLLPSPCDCTPPAQAWPCWRALPSWRLAPVSAACPACTIASGSMISAAVHPRSHHANLPNAMSTNHYTSTLSLFAEHGEHRESHACARSMQTPGPQVARCGGHAGDHGRGPRGAG